MDWYYYDGKDRIGPLKNDQFKELISTGTIMDRTLVWKSGMANWKRWSDVRLQPEIAALFLFEPGQEIVLCQNCRKPFPLSEVINYENRYICTNCKPEFIQRLKEGAPLPETHLALQDFTREILHQDYTVSIRECLDNGFALIKKYFWLVVGATFIVMAISSIFNIIDKLIPLAGTIANLVLSGPLIGGLFYLFIRLTRDKYVEIGNVFDGFKGRNFVQLMLGYIVQVLLFFLGVMLIIIVVVILFGTSSFNTEKLLANISWGFLIPILLLFLVASVYLFLSWFFTLPLIIDKGLNFWHAMRISFKMVNKHWFQCFGVFFVCGLIGVLGVLACCIGLIVTMPIFYGSLAYAYIKIFKG